MSMKKVNDYKKPRSLCIVIPIFNEELALPYFLDALQPIIEKLRKKLDVIVIFVNNGSTDGSVDIINSTDMGEINSAILTLTRNFGYEAGLIAGLTFVTSDCYCLIDADGEDPAHLLLDFLVSIESGNEIAIGLRQLRVESKLLQSFRRLGYKVLARISDDPFTVSAGNFSMFNSKVRNSILIENSSYPFLRATVSRTGFKTEYFPHNRNPRLDGRSNFNKFGLLKFAVAGFMTTTTWPLRMAAYSLGLMLPLGLSALVSSIIFDFSSTAGIVQNFSIFLFLSTQSVNIGIIAIYVARVYKNSLGRPLFYVDWHQSYATKKFPFEYPNENPIYINTNKKSF